MPGGGNNYAAGGAWVSFTGANPNVWSATSQVNSYLALTGGRADPNALYTVWIGINDLKTTTTGGMGNIVFPENTAAITALGQQTAGSVGALAANWRTLFSNSQYDLVYECDSVRRAGNVYGPGAMASTASRALYDQVVWNTVQAMGINFIPADFNSIYNYVLVNPAPFGITTTSLATGACGIVNSYQCTPANYISPMPIRHISMLTARLRATAAVT